MRSVIRRILSWLVIFVAGTILVAVLSEWFIEVARAKGWYADAGGTWDRLVRMIREFVTSAWVLGPLLVLGGLVIGLWLDAMLRRADGFVASTPGWKDKPTAPQDRLRVPPDVTPRKIMSFYNDNTAIQAAELTKHYVGKWIRVSGRISQVSPASPFTGISQVTFERRDVPFAEQDWFDYTGAYMYFPASQQDRLRGLKKGDPVTVEGRINEITSVDLHLDHCEIVDEEPAPPPAPVKLTRRGGKKASLAPKR